MRVLLGLAASAAVFFLWTMAPLPASQEKAASAPSRQARPVPVRTLVAQPAEGYSSRRQYSGVLEASRQSELSFVRSGMLTEVFVNEGDPVAAGQTLARLDTRELSARQTALQAQVAAAEARLAELRAGPRAEPRSGAQADVRRLTSELELARLKQSRRRELYDAGAVPAESLDEWNTQVRSLEQSLEAARQASLELENGTRPEVLAQAQAQVDAARAELAALEVAFADSVLRAPFAGRVVERQLDEGTVVGPGRSVLVLAETSTLEARIALPQAQPLPQQPTLRIGGRSVPARLLGKVPKVDQSSNTAIIRYAVASGLPGEPVTLELEEKVKEPGIWLPVTCLSSAGDGVWQCYAVGSDQTVQVHKLELLHQETDRALVRGTLQAGERVISEGIGQIVPGQKVSAHSAEG